MKIEKITLRNLTSIEGEAVIDFTVEPLRSAGLFAITGDTGSGKSTILDAICLSLYGRAPRFDDVEGIKAERLAGGPDGEKSIQAKDPRNILRRGEKEGGAAVTFSVPDGRRFEATWSVRLKRTGTYDRAVQTLKQTAPRTREYQPDEIKDAVTDILGLDYLQFTRTVMLAQNSFANFLRARQDEKSALLEKLTGTEIYCRISKQIYERMKQAEERTNQYDTQVNSIMENHLSEEDLSAARQEQAELKKQIIKAQDRRAAAQASVAWLDEYEATLAEEERCRHIKEDADRQRLSRRTDEHTLKVYDRVQPVQPVFQEIQSTRQAIADCRAQEERLGREIADASMKQNEAGKARERAKGKREEAERQLADRREDIDTGHQMLGEIRKAEANINRLQTAVTEAERNASGKHDSCEEKRKQLAALADKNNKDKFHRQTLLVHFRMFENFGVLRERLSAFGIETDNRERLIHDLEQNKQQQEQFGLRLEQLEKSLRDVQNRIASARNVLEVNRQAVRGIDGIDLNRRAEEASRRLDLLLRAEKLWRRIADGYEATEERQSKYNRDEVEIDLLRGQIVTQREQVAEARAEHDRCNKSYMLSQSNDIQRLRRELEEGKPCPVCGANHHPYHAATDHALGELVSNLAFEYKDALSRLQREEEQLRKLELRFSALETQHKADMDYIDERRNSLNDDIEEWKQYVVLDSSFADSSSTVNSHARAISIGLLIDKAKRDSMDLNRRLRDFNNHQNSINRLNEEISSYDLRLAEETERLNNVRTDLRITQNEVEKLRKDVDTCDKRYQQLYHDLNDLVTLPAWFEEWKKGREDFILRIGEMEADWRSVNNLIENNEGKIVSAEAELQRLEQTEADARKQLHEAQDNLAQEKEELAQKEAAFRRIFGESNPVALQNTLETRLANCRREELEAAELYEAHTRRIHNLSGQRRKIEEDHQRFDTTYQNRQTELDNWLKNYNGNHTPIQPSDLAELFLAGRDYLALRRSITAIIEGQQKAIINLENVQRRIEELKRKGERPQMDGDAGRAALHVEIEDVTRLLDTLAAQLQECTTRLSNHDAAERRVSELAKEISEAKEDFSWWSRLSKIFGSADGKRMRELAQNYTFNSLVNQANVQLGMLSPRYRLSVIPNTLMLEIIDRDMFDRRRYVSSLSGGETFVVSLALALALANLSGTGLAIGSLFIDEGFGNLDHASLDLVMSALSNLENQQGRKVGIISHTEQIRTQVSPRIHLQRHPAGGKSQMIIE